MNSSKTRTQAVNRSTKMKPLIAITQIVCALSFALFACAACGPKEGDEDKASKVSPALEAEPTVKAVKVKALLLDRELKLPGEILPYQDVPLYPKIPGFIKWIGVDRGYWVKKGQLLVQLIAPEVDAQKHEAEARVLQAHSQIHEAERKLESAMSQKTEIQARLKSNEDTYKRFKKASEIPGVISGNELEIWEQTAEGDRAAVKSRDDLVQAAKAQLASAQDNERAAKQAVDHIAELLAYLKITAPFDGIITERNMHVGSFAYPLHGQDGYPPMLRIKEVSLLRIVIPVPEYAVDGVDVGTEIKFNVNAYPGRTFIGKVARIAHSLEPKTRTEPVELNYWNTDKVVDPGMFPEIHWPMKRSYKTLFVPATAVYESLETPFIVQIKDGKVHRVQVRRGQTVGEEVEVFGDIKEGDIVAQRGFDDKPEGTEVKAELKTD
jgi:RND family efflux transporter MFP subunit